MASAARPKGDPKGPQAATQFAAKFPHYYDFKSATGANGKHQIQEKNPTTGELEFSLHCASHAR